MKSFPLTMTNLMSEMLDSLEVAYVGTISMEDFKSL